VIFKHQWYQRELVFLGVTTDFQAG